MHDTGYGKNQQHKNKNAPENHISDCDQSSIVLSISSFKGSYQ